MKFRFPSIQRCFSLWFLAVISIGFFSCSMSIEKRHYRKGYYIDVVNNNKKKSAMADQTNFVQSSDQKIQKSEMVINNEPEQLIAPIVSLFRKDSIPKRKDHLSNRNSSFNIKKLANRKKTECDLIILKDGTQFEALVENIGETVLTYKKCNFADGPLYSVNINKIEVVQLRNGDYFRPKSGGSNNNGGNKSTSGSNGIGEMVLGILAFIFAFFGMVMSFLTYSYGAIILAYVFGTFGFILGIIGTVLSAAHMESDNFGKTIVGLILSAVAILLFMITIIVLVL